MKRIQTRITLTYFVLTLLAISVFALFASVATQRSLTRQKISDLSQRIDAVASVLENESRNGMVPSYTYRMEGPRGLRLKPRGERLAGKILQNRDIERLFQRFNSVKFFLTRNNLREVIVRR